MLEVDEPSPVDVAVPGGRSPFLLTCDHAGNRIPHALGSLGLTDAELATHIAWDIGAEGVARKLAELLDAVLIAQRYSRLVIDCNRPLDAPSSIVTASERTAVPGNRDLNADNKAERARAIFEPYHARIVAELERRERSGQPTVLITVHSFTPVFLDNPRAWHAGVLYQRDPRLAHALLPLLRAEPGLRVGDNEPYHVSDETDYAVVVYGERRGLLHVELEMRQDLISEDGGQTLWAERLARLLPAALESARG